MNIIYPLNSIDLPERNEFDFYPTPFGFAKSTLEQLDTDFTPTCILDPGAGTGVWGRAARQRWPHALITGVELRPVCRPAAYNFWFQDDFHRVVRSTPCFDLIIGNPPFKYAESFINASLPMLEDGGYMVFLLRLAFLEGQARAMDLWRNTPFYQLIVAARRINFTGDSNPNSYGVFVWRKGYTGKPSISWMIHEDNEPEIANLVTRSSSVYTLPMFEAEVIA